VVIWIHVVCEMANAARPSYICGLLIGRIAPLGHTHTASNIARPELTYPGDTSTHDIPPPLSPGPLPNAPFRDTRRLFIEVPMYIRPSSSHPTQTFLLATLLFPFFAPNNLFGILSIFISSTPSGISASSSSNTF